LLMPNFNDIDGDGDMDIIGQQFQCVGAFAYYKNMSMEHHGVCDTLNDYVIDTYAWGKFALRSGAYTDVTVGFFNINCFSNPNDHYDMSIAAPMDDTYANIATIDIDGDGDMDALIGDSQTKNSLLVINAPASGTDLMVSQDTAFPSYDVPVNIQSFAMHSYVDVDNDQIRDLIVSNYEYEKAIPFYKKALNHQNKEDNHYIETLLKLWESYQNNFEYTQDESLFALFNKCKNATDNET